MNTIISEETEHGEILTDVYQKLSDNRILFITGEINERLASDITATLLLKDQEDQSKKITIFINSPGGDIRNVFMIYDMIKMITAPVETVCVGETFNEAVVLLAAGQKGLRFATKNSFIAVGQLQQEVHAQTDMINAKKYLDLFTDYNLRMMKVFAEVSGKPLKRVVKDFERVVFMTGLKAAKYGLIDKVITFSK